MDGRLVGLMERFYALPHATTFVRDDLDPAVDPVAEMDRAAAAYLARYPFLARYPDYRAFIRHVGGALLAPPARPTAPDFVRVAIYGFGDFEDPYAADAVDADGFFAFASSEARYRPARPGAGPADGNFFAHFALDATGDRPAGVYGPAPDPDDENNAYTLRWPSFLDWLDDLLTHGGRPGYVLRAFQGTPPA